jgi:hypothetical protein
MIQSEWDSPAQNYVYFILAGRWNWDELAAASVVASKMAYSVKRPLCYVVHFVDEIGRRHVPPNVLSYATSSKAAIPPNVVKTIFVNASSVTFGIMSVVFRLEPELREFYVFAPNLEEAARMAVVGHQSNDMI